MGECGCSSVNYVGKVIDKKGDAWLFGVYPGCRECDCPAGVQIHKIAKSDFHLWDVKQIPNLKAFDGVGFIEVVSAEACKKQIHKVVNGYHSNSLDLDEIDAETIADEAFRDMREAVFETMRETAAGQKQFEDHVAKAMVDHAMKLLGQSDG